MSRGPFARRRNLLRSVAIAGGLGLAGCLDALDPSDPTPETFPYPPGFTRDGIDVD